ncbi:MAG: outer membrane lipoprotein carrier protein LolA, partial [Alcanivoracaceae bacterium]|nr:outer membrane lipoprotein carrier protein LolA [Alcanivoracaceae bacterium]
NSAYAVDSTLINQLHEKYQNVSYYQANFIQEKQVSYISKLLITQGRLEFALNEGLIWEVEKPLWVKTLITDKGVFKSTKYQQKQKVRDIQIKLIAEIMTELLTANLDKIESHFKISSVDQSDADNWRINLNPKKMIMKKALKQISLIGIKAHNPDDEINGIKEIIITDKAANITRILLTDIVLHKGPIGIDIRSKFE